MERISLNNRTIPPARLTLLWVALWVVNVACAIRLVGLSSEQAQVKQDFARVNSVRNGLFSMDIWKGHLENIVSHRITNLQLSPHDRAVLKSAIEKIVRTMITQADVMLTENQKSLGSRLRQVAYKTVVDVEELKRRSPELAQAVLDEITQPESLQQLRVLALNQLNQYARESRDNDGEAQSLSQLLRTYRVKDIAAFNAMAGPRIQSLRNQIWSCAAAMILSVCLMVGVWGVLRRERPLQDRWFLVAAALAAVLLITSLSVPMLDIDARIKTVDLMLLGESIQFDNQILFYRSKSILDVVYTLMSSRQGETVFVGFLLLLFSVIFPVAKLTATLLCLFGQKLYRRNKVVDFFAYNSGKWSMADVMVVAIFMSYIGFNSVLNNQLKGLNVSSETWQMITTNETALQPGFLLFVTFVLFSLALSDILKRMLKREVPHLEILPAYPPPQIKVVS